MTDIETQKSLALAELMGWEINNAANASEPVSVCTDYAVSTIDSQPTSYWLQPYEHTAVGLAQFAAILLKFPRVFCRFTQGDFDGFTSLLFDDGYHDKLEPTQANVLDEILKMQGKWQEEWND